MRVLIDMNLSPEWAGLFAEAGMNAVHWSSLGAATATDGEIFDYARRHAEMIVLTQDLDFPQILFETHVKGPSVVLLRVDDELDGAQRQRTVSAMFQYKNELASGALVVIDDHKIRIRALPIG